MKRRFKEYLRNYLNPFEYNLLIEGKAVLGIDEVGRGSIAGPMFVGGVLLTNFFDLKFLEPFIDDVKDSKQMSEQKRNKIGKLILTHFPYLYVVGYPVTVIERRSMAELVGESVQVIVRHFRDRNEFKSGVVIVDGLRSVREPVVPYPDITAIRVKRADSLFLSVKLAALAAKYLRDYMMRKKYARLHPKYGLARNKGYATTFHIQRIARFGSSSIHRTRFLRKIFDRIEYDHNKDSPRRNSE